MSMTAVGKHGHLHQFSQTLRLRHFLSAYLGPGWEGEFKSWQAAARAFRHDEHELVGATVRELQQLAGQAKEESTLAHIFHDDLGCVYRPSSEGLGWHEWSEALSAELGGRPA
jgi:hypothetical protein